MNTKSFVWKFLVLSALSFAAIIWISSKLSASGWDPQSFKAIAAIFGIVGLTKVLGIASLLVALATSPLRSAD